MYYVLDSNIQFQWNMRPGVGKQKQYYCNMYSSGQELLEIPKGSNMTSLFHQTLVFSLNLKTTFSFGCMTCFDKSNIFCNTIK